MAVISVNSRKTRLELSVSTPTSKCFISNPVYPKECVSLHFMTALSYEWTGA